MGAKWIAPTRPPGSALHIPAMVVSALEQLAPAMSGATTNPGAEKGRSFNTNACLAVVDVRRWARPVKAAEPGKRSEIEGRSSIMPR